MITADASDPTLKDCTRLYQAQLGSEPRPAAVIDCERAAVLAANAGGLAALGLTPADRLPATLDSAMPAIAVLREIGRLKPHNPVRRSLILWRQAHVQLRNCDLSIVRNGPPSHVLVVFDPGEETEPGGAPGVSRTEHISGASRLSTAEVAKLAHELKTPLTAIAAAAEIMRDERLGPMGNDKYLGYASDIHVSATHALAVISEMLSASETERQQRTREPLDISALAATTVSALQPLAASRQLRLVYIGAPRLAPLEVNATAVRQILFNLLTNAMKFTPDGGEISVDAGLGATGIQYLAVRDTGDGMNEEAMAYALTDGPRGDDVRPGGGRGIGLSLVRQLASENNAAFEIESAPGRGTTVLIRFARN